jgi:hypothetical protein
MRRFQLLWDGYKQWREEGLKFNTVEEAQLAARAYVHTWRTCSRVQDFELYELITIPIPIEEETLP